MFFDIMGLKNKIRSNKELRFAMKGISLLIVFLMFAGSTSQPETMRIAWVISVLIVCVLFGIDAYFIFQDRKIKFQIYELEKEELAEKKRFAELSGEALPDYVLNQKITEPSGKISLPILYYAIIIVLEILIKVFMIH